jgi:hypothetical protein
LRKCKEQHNDIRVFTPSDNRVDAVSRDLH